MDGRDKMSVEHLKTFINPLAGENISGCAAFAVDCLIGLAGKHYSTGQLEELYASSAKFLEQLQKLTSLEKDQLENVLDSYVNENLEQIGDAYYQGFQDAIHIIHQTSELLL